MVSMGSDAPPRKFTLREVPGDDTSGYEKFTFLINHCTCNIDNCEIYSDVDYIFEQIAKDFYDPFEHPCSGASLERKSLEVVAKQIYYSGTEGSLPRDLQPPIFTLYVDYLLIKQIIVLRHTKRHSHYFTTITI